MVYFSPFLLVFGAYVFTLNPAISLGDSGELIEAAYYLGIPHPPGYPLYTQVGKLFTLIPFGNIAFRLNLMSGFFATLAVYILFKLLKAFTNNTALSLSISLALAFLPVFWRQAVMARVYPLNVFLVSIAFLVIQKWQEESRQGIFYLSAFLIGMSLSSHQISLITIPSFLFLIFTSKSRSLRYSLREIAIFSVFIILGLTVYIYLPIRSSLNPAIDWWDPQSLKSFYETLVQAEYRGKLFSSLLEIKLAMLAMILKSFFSEFSFSLLFGVFGVIASLFYFREWRWTLALLGVILFNIVIRINYYSEEELRQFQQIYRYLLISYFIICIFMAFGFSVILIWLNAYLNRRLIPALSSLIFSVPIFIFPHSLLMNNQKENFIAYDHALNILKTVPNRAALLTGGDNDLFPLWYLQDVEKWNPETAIIGMGGLEMNWYLKMLKERYEKFYPDLLPEAVNEDLSMRFDHSMPIFTLFSVISDKDRIFFPPEDSLIPIGITFQLRNANRKVNWEENQRHWDKYSLRGIFNPLAQSDHQLKDIFRRYAYFFNQRGLLEEKNGAINNAIKYYQAAITLEDSWIFHFNLGLAQLKINQITKALDEFESALRLAPSERVIQFALTVAYSIQFKLAQDKTTEK